MASRIDVSIEHRGPAEERPGEAARQADTCPRCGSHYRDDDLEQNLRV